MCECAHVYARGGVTRCLCLCLRFTLGTHEKGLALVLRGITLYLKLRLQCLRLVPCMFQLSLGEARAIAPLLHQPHTPVGRLWQRMHKFELALAGEDGE